MDFKNLPKKIKKYWLEITLISLSLTFTAVATFLFIHDFESDDKVRNEVKILPGDPTKRPKIFIEIAGSVNNPGLYEASNTERVKNMIDKAGGLNENADRDFFARNFNAASYVYDQEKIYVPSVWEVANGYFIDSKEGTSMTAGTTVAGDKDGLININKATEEELDTLPGVGITTAQKIIVNRPYGALEELINKKIVSEKTFKSIKDFIGI